MIGEDITIAESLPGDVIHPPHGDAGTGELHRALDWQGAFWASSGVPPRSVSRAGWCGSFRS
jgi:hypothetical protein